MKKTFRIIGLMVAAVIAACTMSACSDDDEGEPADPTNHDQELIGTWQSVYEDEDEKEVWTITFGRDGKFVSSEEYWSAEDSTEKYWEAGSWETSGNTLKLTIESSSDTDEVGNIYTDSYSISGSKLTIRDSGTFTRR